MAFSLASIHKAQKRRRVAAPALPPLGSFDPQVLLQYGQNRRTADHAQQQFDLSQAQAQDDFAIQSDRIGQDKGNALADILTQRHRTGEDYNTAVADQARNYAALAHRQSEGALRANVQSAGLLAQSLAKRTEAQQRDRSGLDQSLQRNMADSTTAEQRTNQTADRSRADLALNLARLFGSGSGGNPLGTNTLNLTQTKSDALGGNLDLSAVAFQQAAANGYPIPRRKKRTLIV